METFKKKFKKISLVSLVCLSFFYICAGFTACRPEVPDYETFVAAKGDIEESISSTGIVASSESRNYAVVQTEKVLYILKKGQSFKAGDLLLRIDSSKAQLYLEQADLNIEVAKNAVDMAKINYQSALDANHIAVQLSQSSNEQAKQSTQNAFQAMENANILANTSLSSANNAIRDANAYLEALKSNPLATDDLVAKAESGVTSAEDAYEQAKASARSQTDTAEGAYEQSLDNQSAAYWNSLNSIETAAAQIKLMKKNIDQAVAQLKLAELNRELTAVDFDRYQVIAPFDGIVLTANFAEGEYASPGVGAMSIISKEFIILSDISETDISKVQAGQAVDLVFDAYPQMAFQGTVTEISPISKNIAGIISYEVKVKPGEEAGQYLRHGLSANLNIRISDTKDVLYVPLQAVYEEDSKSFVDVLTEKNEVKKVEVITGNYNYDYIEIKSGISAGGVVITSRIQEAVQENEAGGGFGIFR